MSSLLTEAFEEAARLPEADQEAFAAWILSELASERRWQQAFAETGDLLAQLADEAVKEHRAGGTERLDPETL